MRGRLFGRSAGAGISFPGMGILGGFPLVVPLFGGFEGRIWWAIIAAPPRSGAAAASHSGLRTLRVGVRQRWPGYSGYY